MKQDPLLDLVEKRMQTGIISRDGFLGGDKRRLIEILMADEAEMNRLGIDHQQIAETLQHLLDAGKPGLGTEVEVDGKFLVNVETVRGKLPCPWPGDGLFPKTNVRVKRIDTGEEIVYTAMGVHLIRKHGFYEGKGSYFRLEPAKLKEFLDIQE
ncbi:MAG: hypothetical protein GXP25_07495 [Planctomycetes bacterium]|nr:hypothetical protein [Planctomycetota bacterium]